MMTASQRRSFVGISSRYRYASLHQGKVEGAIHHCIFLPCTASAGGGLHDDCLNKRMKRGALVLLPIIYFILTAASKLQLFVTTAAPLLSRGRRMRSIDQTEKIQLGLQHAEHADLACPHTTANQLVPAFARLWVNWQPACTRKEQKTMAF